VAVLMCIGGVPSVYYGDEQGFRGLKEFREGGDDEIRPAFPSSPGDLAPEGWRYYRLHQRLIGFRRRHPWLARARTTTEYVTPSALALRAWAEDGHILLLLNVGDEPCDFPVDADGLTVAELPDPGTVPGNPLEVAPHSWTILG
jgi:cyclomaltodextrinase / maltogenic alpha-amylase / neopullulanase